MVSRNLERANENDGFKMTALEYLFLVLWEWVTYDPIKGKELRVKVFSNLSYMLTPLSGNLKMLYFDVNPIRIGYLVTMGLDEVVTEATFCSYQK